MKLIIRDAIHEDIYLTEYEKNILDTPEMQRLRGIKQLGMGYLVYPTAMHTRFDHSIGVNYIFKKIIHEMKYREETKRIFNEMNWKILHVSALVHDITHIPFGHTFEDELLIFDRHDKYERYKYFLNTDTEVGNLMEKYHILDDVIKILSTKNPEHELQEPWQAQLITSTICADILDYLKRDAYFCGIPKRYDERILKYFTLEEKDGKVVSVLDLMKRNILREDALTEVIDILRLRYFLVERVYFHHTKIAAGAMLAKALDIARKEGLKKDDLYTLTDEQLLCLLKNYSSAKLIDKIKKRKLLKRAYVLTPRTVTFSDQERFIKNFHLPNSMREKTENEIASTLKIDDGDVIIYCTGRESLKKVDTNVKTPDGIKRLAEMREINQLNEIINSYLRVWRFYVFAPEDKVADVSNLCTDIFHRESEIKIIDCGMGRSEW